MKINRKGVTRIVVELGSVVVKVPNFTCQWSHFLNGILANINENLTWKYNSGKYESGKSHLLCPVRWCSLGGWVLVMQKADAVIDHSNLDLWNCDEHMKHFAGDDTASNYGILRGRLVKIDYGSANPKV